MSDCSISAASLAALPAVARATERGKTALNAWEASAAVFLFVLLFCSVCLVGFFLVKKSYFFSYIFAWKPRDFQSYSNSEGGGLFSVLGMFLPSWVDICLLNQDVVI